MSSSLCPSTLLAPIHPHLPPPPPVALVWLSSRPSSFYSVFSLTAVSLASPLGVRAQNTSPILHPIPFHMLYFRLRQVGQGRDQRVTSSRKMLWLGGGKERMFTCQGTRADKGKENREGLGSLQRLVTGKRVIEGGGSGFLPTSCTLGLGEWGALEFSSNFSFCFKMFSTEDGTLEAQN